MKNTKQRTKIETEINGSKVTIKRVGVESGHVYEVARFDAGTTNTTEIDAQIEGFLIGFRQGNNKFRTTI